MKKYILLVCIATSAMISSAFAASTTVKDQNDCANESHYPMVTKSELKEITDKKSAFIVDVNSDESFQKAHVPGAIHFETHKKDFSKILPKDKKALIVAYCGGPACGAWKTAAEQACKLGYTNIRHFKDGIKGWVAND